jgi:hypothetical protein
LKEHRHVQQIKRDSCHDGHRYRKELVPRRRLRSTRRDRAAAEVVTRPGRSAARQHVAVPDRHGGLCWRASPESQTTIAWSRCTADAGEIRAPVRFSAAMWSYVPPTKPETGSPNIASFRNAAAPSSSLARRGNAAAVKAGISFPSRWTIPPYRRRLTRRCFSRIAMTGLRSSGSDRPRKRQPRKLNLRIRAPGGPPRRAVRA